jgi:hypothetical protein
MKSSGSGAREPVEGREITWKQNACEDEESAKTGEPLGQKCVEGEASKVTMRIW